MCEEQYWKSSRAITITFSSPLLIFIASVNRELIVRCTVIHICSGYLFRHHWWTEGIRIFPVYTELLKIYSNHSSIGRICSKYQHFDANHMPKIQLTTVSTASEAETISESFVRPPDCIVKTHVPSWEKVQ